MMKNNHTQLKQLVLILFFFVLIQNSFAQQQSPVLKILHLSDTHLCNLTGYHPVFAEKRKHYGSGVEPLTEFFETQPQKQDADAVIVTGDLIDFYEAETEKGPWLATQIEQFLPVFNLCPVPLYLTLGNHDIASYWIEGAEKEQFQINTQQARAAWVRNFPSFQNGTYYSREFPVGKTTYNFLFLDNSYSLGNGSYIDKTQLDWLNYQVKKAGENPVIIFMHKYFPLPDLDGDGFAFKADSKMALDEKACSKGLLKTLNESNNIKALFVGHGHRNVSEVFTFPSGHKILQTETAAFAQSPNNWRRIDFCETKLIVYSADDKELELEIPLK